MARLVLLGLLVIALSARSQSPAVEGRLRFTHPLADRPDTAKLLPSYERLAEKDGAEGAWLSFLLFQSLEREGRIHAARDYLDRARDVCSALESAHFSTVPEPRRAELAYLCAITRAESLSRAKFPWRRFGEGRRIKKNLLIAQTSAELDQAERFAAEGRLYATLPPFWGRDEKRALLALRFLERLRPELEAPRQLIAGIFDRREGGRLKDFGLAPHLFYSPQQGFGGGVAWFDDRVADTDRQLTLSTAAGTRAFGSGGARYRDAELIPDYEVELSSEASYGRQDFWGLGMATPASGYHGLTRRRYSAELRVRRELVPGLRFGVGWRGAHVAYIRSFGEVSYSGPFSGFWWGKPGDHRLEVEAFFPTRGLLSSLSFESWRGAGEYWLRPASRHALRLFGGLQGVSSVAPFATLPRLGDHLLLPGVREGRYTDRNLLHFSSEYRVGVGSSLKGLLFGNAVTGSAAFGEVIRSPWRFGGGLGLEASLSDRAAEELRLEAGWLGGETVFRARIGMGW